MFLLGNEVTEENKMNLNIDKQVRVYTWTGIYCLLEKLP